METVRRFDDRAADYMKYRPTYSREAIDTIVAADVEPAPGIRARSSSYVPKAGDAGEQLISMLRELHARYADADGVVSLIYVTEVYRAQRL